jgi:hypothetical protein
MAHTLSTERSVARARLAEYFHDRKTRAGVLARRLLGTPAPDDAVLSEHLIRERRLQTRIDGSMDAGLVPTAWGAWELLQLEAPTDQAGVVRTVGFLLGRQEQPGRVFGEGCRPYMHERRLCSHYVGGFFSAAPEEHPVAPLTFPSGVVVSDERGARFAASCFTLRTVMRAGEDRREGVRRHVASLLDMDGLWSWEDDAWSADARLFGFGAIASAPLDLRDRAARAMAGVLERQEPDGSWPGADLFHALDMVLQGPTPDARAAVARAAPPACRLLGDEALEDAGGEERALIALRALAVAGGGGGGGGA